ncbi:hypothetical protein EGW08_018655 [Elysia chlorotica]|uniref:Uncharacterized protein n=1 Tax=Elysia chlorotica TaxID=188477 RepID=A0A3S1H734_ELYCH|nr:hypothetical protein EGW08_018655 [Elysia chlorotica]
MYCRTAKLKLPLKSILEEYKCGKARLFSMLEDSDDPVVKTVQPSIKTGRKWKAVTAVDQAKECLKIKETLGEVIAKAKQKKVKAALVVTESVKDFEPVLALQQRFPEFVLPCLGIHPVQGHSQGLFKRTKILKMFSSREGKGDDAKLSEICKVWVASLYHGATKRANLCILVEQQAIGCRVINRLPRDTRHSGQARAVLPEFDPG